MSSEHLKASRSRDPLKQSRLRPEGGRAQAKVLAVHPEERLDRSAVVNAITREPLVREDESLAENCPLWVVDRSESTTQADIEPTCPGVRSRRE